ncbi:MAG: hypothetical protein LBC27_04170 [Spirochaetaceae bacterium]|nr:hypothetical protein [Spirochaetaceae bacterium]
MLPKMTYASRANAGWWLYACRFNLLRFSIETSMKQIIFCVFFALQCITVVYSKDRLAVLPFSGGTGDEGDAIAELFSFTTELNQEFEPVPRTTINRAIAAEQRFQKDLGVTDVENAAALAENLGVQYVACGGITKLGDRKLLIISILDVRELRLISGDIQSYRAIEDVRSKLPSMARTIVDSAQRDVSGLPRLALPPVNLIGGADTRNSDTLAQILAINLIRNRAYAVYPRTSSLDQMKTEYKDKRLTVLDEDTLPNMALSVNARKLGAETMFNAAVIDLFTMVQTAGGSVDYRTLEDGILAMESLALKLSGITTDYIAGDAGAFYYAIDAINSNNMDGVYTILVDGEFDGAVNFIPNGNKTITISGTSPASRIHNGGLTSALFTVPNGITLVLGNNITLRGNNESSVTVDVRGGNLVMKAGAVIQSGRRGALMVRGGGSFKMEGGEISGNIKLSGGGGGVYVGVSSSFIMEEGIINGNAAEFGGGVYVSGGGAIFTMKGGVIKGNKAEFGGGVYVSGGGAMFTMTGGSINGNSAKWGGGVYIESGRFVKNGGRIDGDNSSFDESRVFVLDGSKQRITAAGSGVYMDSSKQGKAGGWE